MLLFYPLLFLLLRPNISPSVPKRVHSFLRSKVKVNEGLQGHERPVVFFSPLGLEKRPEHPADLDEVLWRVGW